MRSSKPKRDPIGAGTVAAEEEEEDDVVLVVAMMEDAVGAEVGADPARDEVGVVVEEGGVAAAATTTIHRTNVHER